MQSQSPKSRLKLANALIETFGFSPWLATAIAVFLMFLAGLALIWLWLSAPPRTVTIITGPPGSSFERYAQDYQKFLKTKHGAEVQILPSGGSVDNLKKLQDPKSGVDVAFVQGGLVGENVPPGLVSLGSISYQPMWVYYRSPTKFTRLSDLTGKRIGVGQAGSGTNALAMAMLTANEMTGAPTVLVDAPSENAAKDLVAGKLDAVFFMGEAASLDTLRALLRNPEIRLLSFSQADAYVRRIPYLNKIVLPQGSLDIARNLPAEDTLLVGPAVELIAKKSLNSTISDQIIDAAQFRHSKANSLQRRGEFPAPLEREFPISDDARRYYKSGKGFVYTLTENYWLSSLVNRILVAIVPLLLLMIPAFRLVPLIYRWSVAVRIYRCYRPLLRLERDAQKPLSQGDAQELMERLDEIEQDVNKLKVPASFAYQFYALQGHVVFVRNRLKAAIAAT